MGIYLKTEDILDIVGQMHQAVMKYRLPEHYCIDMLTDIYDIIQTGISKFIWCLRENGTFLFPLRSEYDTSGVGSSYDAEGMKQHPEAKFLLVDTRNGTMLPRELEYDETMKIIDGVMEMKKNEGAGNY